MNKKRERVIGIFIIILLIYHCLMFPARDDLYYMHTLDDMGLWSFLFNRYNTWSSRVVSESLGALLLAFPTFVWKILDIAVWSMILVSLVKFCDDESSDSTYAILLSLILIYPFEHMGTAGWAITNIFYSWPLLFTLIILIVLKRFFYGKKVLLTQKVICVLSVMFCGTTEQSWIVITALCVGLIIYNLLIKRKQYFPWMILSLNFVNLAIITLSPGSKNRMVIEAGKYMPEFFTLTLIDKINAGIISTMSFFLLRFDVIFFLFCIVIVFNVNEKIKNVYIQTLTMIPCIINILFGLFSTELSRSYHQIIFLLNENLINANNYERFNSYIPLLIYLWIICILVMGIYISFDDKKIAFMNIFILGAAFCSRIAMGFSPTLYASAERTFIFAYFSLIICTFLLYNNLTGKRTQLFVKRVLILSAMLMVCHQIVSIELYR